MDLGRHVLRWGREEVSLWRPVARPWSSRITLVSDEVIPATCDRVLTARPKGPFEAANRLVVQSEYSPLRTAHSQDAVSSWAEGTFRIVNVSEQDQVQGGGSTLDCCELVTWTAPIDALEPTTQKMQGHCEQLQRVVSGARSNLNTREAQKWEEFITDFQDLFATKRDEYGGIEKPSYRHRRCPSDTATRLQTA
jgi:hypothetical protein